VPPAYRPGMVPRVALAPRMGFRGRGQLMNDLMGECPGLLDDLGFYPMWTGSQCIDMISGKVATINGTITNTSAPNGEVAKNFSSSGAEFALDVIGHGDRQCSMIAWIYPTSFASHNAIITDGLNTGTLRGNYLSLLSGIPTIFLIGTYATNCVQISAKTAINTNMWQTIGIRYNGSMRSSGVNFFVSGKPVQPDIPASDTLTTPYVPGANLNVGIRNRADLGFSGSIGPSPIWGRALSDVEHAAFYNGGLGLRYPFRR
jgi:hypothetical protein